MNAGAAIADFYTISRIMKSNEYNNCILYVGVAHLDIIHNYLININYKYKLIVCSLSKLIILKT